MPIHASRIDGNGGFPPPPPAAAVRVVSARHPSCGERTRVRLPELLPARTVRRVVCRGCAAAYEARAVVDEGIVGGGGAVATGLRAGSRPAEPARPLRARLLVPSSRSWRWLSLALAGGGVVAALVVIQGDGGGGTAHEGMNPASRSESGPPPGNRAQRREARAGGASFVRESSYSVALPPGWERVAPPGGATFAATSPSGDADATLWVERAPRLDFPAFEARSLEQLRQLAGSARVVDRVTAPTPEATVIQLAADAPEGAPAYEVVLRVAGPYRYYLATTAQPGAAPESIEAVELIQGSFTPEAATSAGEDAR